MYWVDSACRLYLSGCCNGSYFGCEGCSISSESWEFGNIVLVYPVASSWCVDRYIHLGFGAIN